MALSRAQQILIKRAQHQAVLGDEDYRNALSVCTGEGDCRSSKDPRLTDAHLDILMAYLEAVYWRAVDGEQIRHIDSPKAVFRERGFWAARNRRGNTSRDRHADAQLSGKIAQAEADLAAMGFGASYLGAIRAKVGGADWKYLGALQRTIEAKRKRVAGPF